MIHATRRGVRRSTPSGNLQRKVATLQQALDKAEAEGRPCRLDGRPRGARILCAMMSMPASVMLTFRHPTKRATEGRYAFLQVSTAPVQKKEEVTA